MMQFNKLTKIYFRIFTLALRLVVTPFLCAITIKALATGPNSLEQSNQGCQAFTAKLSLLPHVTYGFEMLPRDWNNSMGEKVPVFWWKRQGTDLSYPPIVFLHGGVASNSWALLDKWKDVINGYPGDLIAFDHRGEGCAKTVSSNEDPSVYKHYSVRNIVKDIEWFRKNKFLYPKWRVVGHSRGAAIIHYYLEMAPKGIESAHAMGFAMMSKKLQKYYPLFRAQGYYDSAKAYLKIYPEDEARVKWIRSQISETTCWSGLDGRNFCGPNTLDVFANFLSRKTSWADLHLRLEKMTSVQLIYEAIQSRVNTDVYGHFNYIVGTNSKSFGNPNPVFFKLLQHDPVYTEPFLSEIRYVAEVVAPTAHFLWKAAVDPVNYSKIEKYLRKNHSLKYFLYSGALDPIAPPHQFEYETSLLGPLVELVSLPNSAHDGWFDPILLNRIMQKFY